MRSPPGGSTPGMLRYSSVTAVEFNTFLALLPKTYNKISVTIDWLSKVGNNHVLRANASKVHAVVIVDICASVIGLHPCSFCHPTMGKCAYLHEISSIQTLERDFGLLTL